MEFAMNDSRIQMLEKMIADDERLIHELNTKLKVREKIIKELIDTMSAQANAQLDRSINLVDFMRDSTLKMVQKVAKMVKDGQ
jgi:uncharacterized coiled-coil protein SlyX